MKEAIQQYNAVVAACLFIAYQDLSSQRNVDIQEKVFLPSRLGNGGTDMDTKSVIPGPDPSDPAEACLSDIPIAKWNSEQVRIVFLVYIFYFIKFILLL